MKLSDLKKELEKRSLPITGTKMTLELRLKASRERDQKSINIPIPAAATPLISRANAGGRTVSMDRGQEKPDYLKPMGTPFSFGLQDRPQTKPIVVSKARKVIAPPRPLRATSTQGSGDAGSAGSDVAMSMDLDYPPKAEFLPISSNSSSELPLHNGNRRVLLPRNERNIHSRIGPNTDDNNQSGGGRLSGRLTLPQKRVSVFNRLKSEEEECGGARDDNSNLRNEFEDRECGLEDLGGNLDDEVFNEERRLARSKRFQEGKGNTRMFGKAVMQLGGHSESVGQRPLVEVYQEYDIDKMEDRAHKFSDVVTLKRRARRFDEETADELVQPKEARRKNDRFKRFKLGDQTSSSEDEDFEDEK